MNNEPPGPSEIAQVTSRITKQNADQAFDLLMGVKVIGLLLANQDENNADLDTSRLKDLGRLIFFLADQPSSVLGELYSAIDDDDPDPGKEEPVLMQSVGGAS